MLGYNNLHNKIHCSENFIRSVIDAANIKKENLRNKFIKFFWMYHVTIGGNAVYLVGVFCTFVTKKVKYYCVHTVVQFYPCSGSARRDPSRFSINQSKLG